MREGSNFIRDIVIEDIKSGKHDYAITRFPPEPNGLLHIGHCKALTINFDIAREFNGFTYLRFDDTNPAKEDERFVKLIKEDIRWMGFEWKELRYASDYFEEMYKRAHILIDKGLAYIDDISPEEMRRMRGSLTRGGVESKNRNRPIEESRDLFTRMKKGEFPEGSLTLRAKISMDHPNIIMRDPVIYRIVDEPHYRTGDDWHIYPMYDFAHPMEDYVEKITHSLCSLEFENNRPLYDWYLEHTDVPYQPRQYEFAKLIIEGAIIGKRHIMQLVEKGLIDGWDDPRLLTISGMRRRGYRPQGIKNFIRATGVSKENSVVEMAMLEHFIREDLKIITPRVMAVLDPLKVVISNYTKESEQLTMNNNVENPQLGSREISLSREIYIEREDFSENPPKGFKRLSPGKEVRLMGAYFIRCDEVIKDKEGKIIELVCSYDEKTKSGSGFKERKPQGTIHWVDKKTSVPARVYRFGPLIEGVFDSSLELADQVAEGSVKEYQAQVEGVAGSSSNHQAYQFIRHGYFAKDETHPEKLTFNETVSLKSSYRPRKK